MDTAYGCFLTKNSIKEKLPSDSNTKSIIPLFKLFVTGDLSYYAYMLWMSASTSYWCPWCLISHPEWQQSAEINGYECTEEFQRNTYAAIKIDHALPVPNDSEFFWAAAVTSGELDDY